MAEQPEHLIEEEEDDFGDSQTDRSWSPTLRMRQLCESRDTDSPSERFFTAGATRTYQIPTVATRCMSGLPPASTSPALVSAQRTVYSVDKGMVQVTVKPSGATPPSSPGYNAGMAHGAVLDIPQQARDLHSLSPPPGEEGDRLSSATPTPTASPRLVRQAEVDERSRSPLQPSLSVTSQESLPSVEEATHLTKEEPGARQAIQSWLTDSTADFLSKEVKDSDDSKTKQEQYIDESQIGPSRETSTAVTEPSSVLLSPSAGPGSVTSEVSEKPCDQSKRKTLTLAGSSQNIRGMIEKFNNISDSPESSSPVALRRESVTAKRRVVYPAVEALHLQKSKSDDVVTSSVSTTVTCEGADGNGGSGPSSLPVQQSSSHGSGAISKLAPPVIDLAKSSSLPEPGSGMDGFNMTAALPPRWSPLPPIASQVPRLTSSPASSRRRIGPALAPSTPTSLPAGLGSSGIATGVRTFSSCALDSSLDSSFDSAAFDPSLQRRDCRSPTPTTRAERLRRARDEFFGAKRSGSDDITAQSGAQSIPSGRSPLRPPRRHSSRLTHSKSTGTINEGSRISDVSCGSDFSDVSVDDARAEVTTSSSGEMRAAASVASSKQSTSSRVANFLRLRQAKKKKKSNAIGALIRQTMAMNASVQPDPEPEVVIGAAAEAPPTAAPARSCPSTPVAERAGRSTERVEPRSRPSWSPRKLFRSPTPEEKR